MLEISFGYTSPAFILLQKVLTRRCWKASHVKKFYSGKRVRAINTDRRCGGKPIGEIELTHDVIEQPTGLMPESDFKKEGFEFLEKHRYFIKKNSPFYKFDSMRVFFEWWKEQNDPVYVVRFKVIDIESWYLKQVQEEIRRNLEKG
jgi:hypothetical protein